MHTYPIRCHDSRTNSKTRTSPMAIPVGSRCVKGVHPAAAARAAIEAMMITEMMVSAFNENGSQLYRGI
ncbi:hypothetical protein [uncultured Thiodictyon sp.]|uniref:hypothetical protein n=1 Tax=uncultured Thiodictyon sp. TaxID=1846217 RepID=UPI0025FC664A|nr:hypothetical protein [uncultured Thiodictyon sp.]